MDAGPPPACEAPVLPALGVEEIAPGSFDSPLFVTQAPGSADTLWVVERGGVIKVVRGGAVVGDFLDISGRIVSGGEQGLLGLAFHPDYATNGRFFVYYTANGSGANVVAEYRRSAGSPDVADAAEVARLVDQADFAGNHNGGMLAFGRDGFLYAALGDGGGGCDPRQTGQDLDTLLGKILRLDVDAGPSYAAAGNPFMGGGGLPQIWAYGLRNPWRFSFDRVTGDMYIGDVGQGAKEEIDFEAFGGGGGINWGWSAREGDGSSSLSGCSPDTVTGDAPTEPIVVVDQGAGTGPVRGACSITGGYVYRGSAIPELQGVYLFGDYCSDDRAAFRYCDGMVRGYQRVEDLSGVGGGLASWGQDNAGELYMVFIGSNEVYKIVPM